MSYSIFDLLQTTPLAVIPIKDLASLKQALVNWTNANAELPTGAVHLNRLYNRPAARYGTTVSELLVELYKEQKIVLVPCKRTGANFVICLETMEGLPEAMADDLREELKREPSAYEIGNRVHEQIQSLIDKQRQRRQ